MRRDAAVLAARPAAPRAPETAGERLIYLMGPSGSGKDTLLRILRDRLAEDEAILIAHRYITRASGPDETALQLAPGEFARRAALGCFALHWCSHGLHYGIGIEIDAWMQGGKTVIVNGSRAHLAAAHARYPRLRAVEVAVEGDVLARRLAARGRETPEQIAERLRRAGLAYDWPPGLARIRLDNNGAPETAAGALLDLARS